MLTFNGPSQRELAMHKLFHVNFAPAVTDQDRDEKNRIFGTIVKLLFSPPEDKVVFRGAQALDTATRILEHLKVYHRPIADHVVSEIHLPNSPLSCTSMSYAKNYLLVRLSDGQSAIDLIVAFTETSAPPVIISWLYIDGTQEVLYQRLAQSVTSTA